MSLENPARARNRPPPPSPLRMPLSEAHALLSSFSNFLTVAIHNILFYRALYPPTTFLAARSFGLPVHQNRHPRVCSWVHDAVNATASQLATGGVSRVAVVINASSNPSDNDGSGPGSSQPPRAIGAVMERWMFDTSHFPAWPGGANAYREYADREARQRRQETDADREAELRNALVNFTDVDEQLRGALRRIAYAAEKMVKLPCECTFTVAVELREEGDAPIGHSQPWIPSEPDLQPRPRGSGLSGEDVDANIGAGEDLGGQRVTPVRAVEIGPLFFECWVEEGQTKLDATKSSRQSQPPS